MPPRRSSRSLTFNSVPLDLSGDEILICCDPELAAPILSASDVNAFPKAPTYQFLADAIVGDGLVTTGGDYWRSHRHVLTPLFHFKSLKSMVDMMIVFTGDLVKRLEKEGAEKYHRVDKVLSRFTMAQIVYLAFGGAMDIDWLHERQTRIGEVYTGFVAMNIFFGPLSKYLPFTAAWKTVKLKSEIEDMIRHVISETRRNNTATSADATASGEVNLISTMINAKSPVTGQLMTDDEIIGECTTFLFAGFDTTSISYVYRITRLSCPIQVYNR
jgi:cytochrome P450